RLDRSEGVPRGFYRRIPIEVVVGGEERVAAFTYQSSWTVAGRKPSARYLGLLVAGAREHGLPAECVRFLESHELARDERQQEDGRVHAPPVARPLKRTNVCLYGSAGGQHPMARAYHLISADSHILEPPHLWKQYMPRKFHDKAPRVVPDGEGGEGWQFGPDAPPSSIGIYASAGRKHADVRWTGVPFA